MQWGPFTVWGVYSVGVYSVGRVQCVVCTVWACTVWGVYSVWCVQCGDVQRGVCTYTETPTGYQIRIIADCPHTLHVMHHAQLTLQTLTVGLQL